MLQSKRLCASLPLVLALVALAVLVGAPDAGAAKPAMDLRVVNLGLESIVSLELKIPGEEWTTPLSEVRVPAKGVVKRPKAIRCHADDTVGWDLNVLSLGEKHRFKGEEPCRPGEVLQVEWGFDVARGEMTAGAVWLPAKKPKR